MFCWWCSNQNCLVCCSPGRECSFSVVAPLRKYIKLFILAAAFWCILCYKYAYLLFYNNKRGKSPLLWAVRHQVLKWAQFFVFVCIIIFWSFELKVYSNELWNELHTCNYAQMYRNVLQRAPSTLASASLVQYVQYLRPLVQASINMLGLRNKPFHCQSQPTKPLNPELSKWPLEWILGFLMVLSSLLLHGQSSCFYNFYVKFEKRNMAVKG